MWLAVVAVFVALSIVLHKFPLSWQKCKLSPRISAVTTIGHRGCRMEGYPENSIAAFKHSVRSGCDMIELDVHLTKDKQVGSSSHFYFFVCFFF
jgi:hypothetical protein